VSARIILGQAARHISQYGWTQGKRGRAYWPCCVLGAIDAVSDHYVLACDARRLLCKSIGLPVGTDTQNQALLIEWNDTKRRTARDVITALETA